MEAWPRPREWVDPLAVLFRLLYGHLQGPGISLHHTANIWGRYSVCPEGWWGQGTLHLRVLRHISPLRRKCGFCYFGWSAWCLQLWPQQGTTVLGLSNRYQVLMTKKDWISQLLILSSGFHWCVWTLLEMKCLATLKFFNLTTMGSLTS